MKFTGRPLRSSASERRISQLPELWESYELNNGIRFSHRTAYNFLFESSKGREYLGIKCPLPRNCHVLNALVQLSKLKLLALDAEFFAHFGYTEWVKSMIESAANAESDTETALMNNIDRTMAIIDEQYQASASRTQQPVDFLSLVAYSRAHRYVQHVLDEQQNLADPKMTTRLICCIVFGLCTENSPDSLL